MTYAIPILLALIGNMLIYTGIAFINQHLAPIHLAQIYTSTGEGSRALIMLLFLSLPANWIFAKVYQTAPSAGIAGMAVLGTLLVVLVTKVGILEGVGSIAAPRTLLALSVALFGVLWLGWELAQGSA